MADALSMQRAIAAVAETQDADQALDRLARAALELTSSRHALVALLDDEVGLLEVRHGAGDAFSEAAYGTQIEVAVADRDGVVSYVAATGRAWESGDVSKVARYRKLFETTRSEIAAPIKDRYGRVRGVLNVESDALNAYGVDGLEACLALASLAALVLERKELLVREEALIAIGGALNKSLSEEALLDQVTHVAGEVLRFQAASIFLRDPGGPSFVLKGSTSRLQALVDDVRYAPGEGCTGWVCETGQPILLQNPQSDPRWRGRYTEFPSDEIASFLCVPILIKRRPEGAIRLLRRKTKNAFIDNRFTENDLRLMEAISDEVATGLVNIRNVDRLLRSERMVAWGELSAKSSHMIGNRVFALKGDINELAHLVGEPKLDARQIAEVARSLGSNVTRIEEILQDFRDFVSATQLEVVPGDLNALVRETVREVFPKRSGVELKLRLDRELPPVQMDAKKLRRAISELIENALHYVDGGRLGARVKLSTGLAKSAARPPMARLVVEDSGPGVEEAARDRIFQPFFSNRAKGMGLGLSIVKGIVEGHGGYVEEEGKPGSGARFVIRLPLADRP